jgi:hypothetical protein
MLRNNKSMSENVMGNGNVFKFLIIRNIMIIIHANIFALSQLYLTQPVVQTINCMGPVFTFLAD